MTLDPLDLDRAKKLMQRWAAAEAYILAQESVQALNSACGSIRTASGVTLTVEAIHPEDLTNPDTFKRLIESFQGGHFAIKGANGKIRVDETLGRLMGPTQRFKIKKNPQPTVPPAQSQPADPKASQQTQVANPANAPAQAVTDDSTHEFEADIEILSSQELQTYLVAMSILMEEHEHAEAQAVKEQDKRPHAGPHPTSLATLTVARPRTLERRNVDPSMARNLMRWAAEKFTQMTKKFVEHGRKIREERHERNERYRKKDERTEDTRKEEISTQNIHTDTLKRETRPENSSE